MKNLLLIYSLLFSSVLFGQISDAYLKSYEYEYNQEYTKAIASLAAVYDAQSYVANVRMGWLTYSNGDYIKSKNYYANAIKLSPNSIEARLGMAYPLAALQNWKEIITVYQEIIAISPNHFTANYRLSLIYYNKKKFNEALGFAEKLNKQYPFHFDNNVLLGKIYLSLGKITQAKEALTSALLYNPTSVEVIGLLKVL